MRLTTGISKNNDSYEAGKEAVEQAEGADSEIIYLFASTSHDLDRLIDGAQEAAKGTPLVGASSTVEITKTATEGAAVAGGFHDVKVSIGLGKGLDDNSYEAGKSAVNEAIEGFEGELIPYKIGDDGQKEKNVIVNMFADTLHGHGVHILDGITEELGYGFSTAGQFAGDDLSFENTFIFYNEEVLEDAVSCIIMETENEVGGDKAHGFDQTPNKYEVTDADATYLKELDGKRPLTVYKNLFGEENAEDPGFLLMTPLGIDRGEKEPQLRVTLDVDEEGCFSLGAPIEEDIEINMMRAKKPKLLDAAGKAAKEALEDAGLGKNEAKGALVFSCAGRHAVYDDMNLTEEEINRISEELGEDVPILGLFAFGQVATTNGRPRFHEETASIQVFR
jgi:hypothetical protein